MQFGDLNPVLGKIITLLKQIEHNTACAVCGVTLSPTVEENASIAAGASYVRVTKTNGVGTVDITFPDASVFTLTAQDEFFEIPYTGGILPAITVSSGDGGTWSTLTLTK